MLFLHDMGYNFVTINTLTMAEIDMIIEAFNDREKEKEKQLKKSKK